MLWQNHKNKTKTKNKKFFVDLFFGSLLGQLLIALVLSGIGVVGRPRVDQPRALQLETRQPALVIVHAKMLCSLDQIAQRALLGLKAHHKVRIVS